MDMDPEKELGGNNNSIMPGEKGVGGYLRIEYIGE